MDSEAAVAPVTLVVDGRVATISLNRPEYRNAQSRKLLEALDVAFAEAVADHEVRVIVLRGEGEHFSSGHDLGTPEELADQQARPYPDGAHGVQRRSWDLNVENTLRWRDIPKPTIAAVQGWCIYGGWMIASAMDLIVAADDAKFLPAHFQYFSVPWDIPNPRRAKELLWLADVLTADEAAEAGFVSHVVARDELDAYATDLAGRIARQNPYVSQVVKRSVNQMQDLMGFRNAITAAHSTYLLTQNAGLVVPKGDEGQIRRLPSVQRSLDDAAADDGGDDHGS